MELKSNEEKVTLALLLSVDCGSYDAEASLDELCEDLHVSKQYIIDTLAQAGFEYNAASNKFW